jgi:hypothetical protein
MMKFDILGRKSGSESLAEPQSTELVPHCFNRTSFTSSITFCKLRTISVVSNFRHSYVRARLMG